MVNSFEKPVHIWQNAVRHFSCSDIYSQLSLCWVCLSRINRLSLRENPVLVLTWKSNIRYKILWKRRETASKEQFLLFSTIVFNISLSSRVKLHIHLWKVVVQFTFFLNSANLICQGTHTSKYFRESLGLWDYESRLYVKYEYQGLNVTPIDIVLIVLGFNDTSTLEGHFVSSPREREKRDRRESRGDEREGQGRKRNRNESEETEELKTFPLYPYPLQG